MFKRIGLFILVNLLIVTMVSIVFSVLGVGNYLTPYGIDYTSLMIFCLVWGFASSLVSLWVSKWMAKMMFGVRLIDPNEPGARGDIARLVHRLAKAAGIEKMPEVGIYPGQEVNAFATGPTKNKSLVCVSEGLLQAMDRDEIEGVLGHEVAHIANGDMVTMTLIQGVVNAFVMFLARILAYGLSMMGRNSEEEGPNYLVQTIAIIVFQIFFGLLGSMVTAWFSRHREFRADAGGARLAGRTKMVAALEKLKRNVEAVSHEHESMAALKISSGKPSGILALLSTHPPLEDRIGRLREMRS